MPLTATRLSNSKVRSIAARAVEIGHNGGVTQSLWVVDPIELLGLDNIDMGRSKINIDLLGSSTHASLSAR